MIRRVRIEGFKRFDDVEFVLPGHIVVAGPNNSGKTTLLQAIASWSLALNRWKELNDFHPRNGYTKAPIARHAFFAVPLRSFDLLWRDRAYRGRVKITVTTDEWSIPMLLEADSTEQIYVRPAGEAVADTLRKPSLTPVLVPSMSGLSIQEPVYQRPKLDELLGLGKTGEMLRNLLVEAHRSTAAWSKLQESIHRLFGCQLVPPNAEGANIIAEYHKSTGGARFDIASAGSGFQQVLMLLTMLNARPGAVLLLDEPDAHLHVFLQDAIFHELRAAAAGTGAQLVVATHSEVVINSVDPRELCVLVGTPRLLSTTTERDDLIEALGVSNDDIVRFTEAPGALYLEGHTDLDLLRAWARGLNHPALALLTRELFWKQTVVENRKGGAGVKARDHYDALRLAGAKPALEILDGDGHPERSIDAITGQGFQRWRWRRYEIESYLVHPIALARFVGEQVGDAASAQHVADLDAYLRANLPPAIIERPLDDHPYLRNTKARIDILPPALNAAGLPNFDYTRYHEIAALMLPDEIHPDVVETLDVIVRAFGQ